MTKKLKKTELIELEKKKIKEAGYERIITQEKSRYGSHPPHTIGHMYIKEKMDYGFHIYFIYEPDSHKLAGKNGILAEMRYDLRHKEYWIKRNLKEVTFSERNIESMFPNRSSSVVDLFNNLSTKNNAGLYESARKYLSRMGNERSQHISRFLYRLITDHSYYEILYKSGLDLNKEVNSIRIENPNGKSPREILGITKTRWKIISQHDIPPHNFKSWYEEKYDQKMLNYLNYVAQLGENYGLNKVKRFFYYEADEVYESGTEFRWRSSPGIRTAKRYGLSEKRLIEYLYFECEVSQGLDIDGALEEYEDYVRMNVEMDNINYEKYPKFLRTMHDIAAMNYRIELDEIQKKNWRKNIEKISDMVYRYNGYEIFPPQEPEDLVKEGNALNHCVGSYVRNVANGNTTILFLREQDDIDKSLVTVEVRSGAIAQARGKMNDKVTIEQSDFLKRFAKKFDLKYNSVYDYEEAV